MPIYTIRLTVELVAESESEALALTRHAIFHSRKADIGHIESEVIATRLDVDEGDNNGNDNN